LLSEEKHLCETTDSNGACIKDDVSLMQISAKIEARSNSSSHTAHRKPEATVLVGEADNLAEEGKVIERAGKGGSKPKATKHHNDTEGGDDDDEADFENEARTAAEMKKLGLDSNEHVLKQQGELYLENNTKEWHNTLLGVGLCVITITVVLAKICCLVTMENRNRESTADELRRGEVLLREPEPLEASTYTLAFVTIIRDVYNLSHTDSGDPKRPLRVFKIIFAVALALCTSLIQIVLIYCTKHFVTPIQVESIQGIYQQYEEHMYLGGTYHKELFDSLTDYEKHSVCQIPLSQPAFFAVLLLVWTVTCLGKIKQCSETFLHVCLTTPTSASMAESLAIHCEMAPEDKPQAEPVSEGSPEGDKAEDQESQTSSQRAQDEVLAKARSQCKPCMEATDDELNEDDTRCVVLGIPLWLKFFITMLIVPWLSTNLYALWLGCRWLDATADFSGLIGNCVALEFILHIEEMLFYSWVTDHHKREMDSILFIPQRIRERLGWFVVFNGVSWALIALCWVYAYMWYFQSVLPSYRWDVADVCGPYLQGIIDRPTPSLVLLDKPH
jgi:hypothetical protein